MRLGWAIAAGLALGVAAGAFLMWKERGGRLPDFAASPGSPPAAPAAAPADASPGPRLYRWRDDAGVLQVTDVPPEGRPYEEVKIRADQNVVPMSGPAPEPEPEGAPAD